LEALKSRRMVFFKETDWVETPIYAREKLVSGNRVEGPAVVEQYDATTVIPPGWNAVVDGFSNLCLSSGEDT